MNEIRSVATALALLALSGSAGATAPELRLEIHYAPGERLDAVDAALIASATTSIDFAAYVLTDKIVIDALASAALRGVEVRVVLDPREHSDLTRLAGLGDRVRVKRGDPYMHMKSYEIDGAGCAPGARISPTQASGCKTTMSS